MSKDESRVIFSESCFAEYWPLDPEDTYRKQPWTVQKYADDWNVSLEKESDVVELMARLDALARRSSVGGR